MNKELESGGGTSSTNGHRPLLDEQRMLSTMASWLMSWEPLFHLHL